MDTGCQCFRHQLPTPTTQLCGIIGTHIFYYSTSFLRFVLGKTHELSPAGVTNRLGYMMVLHQVGDRKFLIHNEVITIDQFSTELVMKILSLMVDLPVYPCHLTVLLMTVM